MCQLPTESSETVTIPSCDSSETVTAPSGESSETVTVPSGESSETLSLASFDSPVHVTECFDKQVLLSVQDYRILYYCVDHTGGGSC